MGKKKESAFMRDIINIIKEENVVTTISEEDAHINYCGDKLDGGSILFLFFSRQNIL